MSKKSKSIRSINSIRARLESHGEFCIYHQVTNDDDLTKIGFSKTCEPGTQVIPNSLGKHTEFNTNGKEIIRKDLPKVTKEYSRWAEWKDFQGNTQSGIQSWEMLIYPREKISPPEETLTYIEHSGEKLIISRPLNLLTTPDKEIIHIINMFLEIYKNYDVMKSNLEDFQALAYKLVPWKILPPGEHPFEKDHPAIKGMIKRIPAKRQALIRERITTVTEAKPSFMAIGAGGFSDYVVFGFPDNIYVLESHSFGNATYIFKESWENFSKLTKKQIIENNLHHARLVHNKNWRADLSKYI